MNHRDLILYTNWCRQFEAFCLNLCAPLRATQEGAAAARKCSEEFLVEEEDDDDVDEAEDAEEAEEAEQEEMDAEEPPALTEDEEAIVAYLRDDEPLPPELLQKLLSEWWHQEPFR